jgi:hypothetical protein
MPTLKDSTPKITTAHDGKAASSSWGKRSSIKSRLNKTWPHSILRLPSRQRYLRAIHCGRVNPKEFKFQLDMGWVQLSFSGIHSDPARAQAASGSPERAVPTSGFRRLDHLYSRPAARTLAWPSTVCICRPKRSIFAYLGFRRQSCVMQPCGCIAEGWGTIAAQTLFTST